MAHRVLVRPGVKSPREMILAGAGSVLATAVDVALLVLLVEHARVAIPVAAFAGSSAGAVVCFLLSKYIAFRDRSPITLQQVARFGFVAVASALLMAVAMQLVAVDLHVPYGVAKVFCAAALFIAWSYPAQRLLVFRPVSA